MSIPKHDNPFEPEPPSVLDQHGHDRLLDKLIEKHGSPRFDLTPEITAATRVARSAA
jgi:hypothetical protein